MTPARKAVKLDAEWLQADGQGGFASGTVGGFRTRRYHALLLAPLRPPTSRVVLVNGFEAWVSIDGNAVALSTQHYAPDVTYPRGIDALVAFAHEPWPHWTFGLPGGARLVHECLVDPVDGSVVLSWRLDDARHRPATLNVRPLLSGRDHHALMQQNPAFAFTARAVAGNATWRPYAALPAISALSNGAYRHDPQWFRNFHYSEEAARGLDAEEDLASPGAFDFDLCNGEALMVLRAGDHIGVDACALAARVRGIEAARRQPLAALQRAAEAYLVRRAPGHTVIAGYPWFTDWGRDTFIAMRGLLLAQRPLRHRRIDPRCLGRPPERGHAAEPLCRWRRNRGIQRRRCIVVVRDRGARVACRQRGCAEPAPTADAGGADHRRCPPTRHPPWHPHGRRCAAGLRRAGPAADLDGREGGRPRDHAAHRQAGGGAGAVDQCAGVCRTHRTRRPSATVVRARASGTHRAAASTTSSMPTTTRGQARRQPAAEPDLRRRRLAGRAARWRPRGGGAGHGANRSC